MLKEYVLDANVLLRYLRFVEALGGDKVQELFEQSARGDANLLMSVVNFREVYYTLLKLAGERATREYIKRLHHSLVIIDADEDSTIEAATLKHAHKIGYADSFAASLALSRRATLVSADPAFEKFGRSLKWLRLPAFIAGSRAKPQRH